MNPVRGGGVWGLKIALASILWLKYGESTLKSKLTQAVSSRRVFMMQVAAVSGVMGGLTAAHAADMVKEDDAQAKSLAYVADATKSKHAKYAAGQVCGNCALFQGKAGDAAGERAPLAGTAGRIQATVNGPSATAASRMNTRPASNTRMRGTLRAWL